MHYIIDAFNLGYKVPEVARFIKQGRMEEAVRALVSVVRGQIPGAGRVILVVDGRPVGHKVPLRLSGVELQYSQKPQTADDLIRAFIRKEKNVSLWTVVSADLEIIHTARDHGARVVKPADFLKKVQSGGRTGAGGTTEKPSADSVDVAYWKQLFEKGNDDSA
ncbi:MAG: hypothetical protein D6677_12035 [Calditrichaeota bacterium]|nr:MAG: hypothetical protein D6677_12035 [Calditrichota bacterium]